MIYSIDVNSAYLERLANFILQKKYDISSIVVVMNSGISCYYLKEILKIKIGKTSFLPEIIPITRIRKISGKAIIGPSEQKFLLAQIISSYLPLNVNFLNALQLSGKLANLFSEFIRNNITLDRINSAAAKLDESAHWQIVQDFLDFALNEYKLYLSKNNITDLAAEQNQTIQDFISYIKNSDNIYIFSGFIINDEVTKNLLHNISKLSNCDIIFPAIESSHSNSNELKPTSYIEDLIMSAKLSQTTHLLVGSNFTKQGLVKYFESSNIFDEVKSIVSIVLDIINNNHSGNILIVTKNLQLIRLIQQSLWSFDIEINNHITQNIMVKAVVSFFMELAKVFQSTFTVDGLIQLFKSPHVGYEIFNLEAKIIEDKIYNLSFATLFTKYKELFPYLQYLEEFFVEFQSYEYFSEFLSSQLKLFIRLVEKDKLPANFLIFLNELQLMLKDVKVSHDDYFIMLKSFLSDHNFSEKLKTSSRVIVADSSEAIYIDSDFVIIPEFIDKIWPGSFNEDPWLTQDIRKSLNLTDDKSHISFSYYLFHCLLNRAQLYITLSKSYGGKSLLPSRFLSKISNRLEKNNIPNKFVIKDLDKIPTSTQVSNLPLIISATALELLIRNPYGFYASRILRLSRFKYLYDINYLSEFGIFIHKAIELYTKEFVMDERNVLCEKFINIANEILVSEDYLFKDWWHHKICLFAPEFIEFEITRRQNNKIIYTEKRGQVEINLPSGRKQIISAIADRVEICQDNIVHIFDYKTGTLPCKQDIEKGIAVQLVVNAIIAQDGGFEGVKPGMPIKLYYVKILSIPPYLNIVEIELKKYNLQDHKDGLIQLLNKVSSPNILFIAYPNVDNSPKYDDYKHLARIGN